MSLFELLWHDRTVDALAVRLVRGSHAQSTVEYALVGALVVIAAAAAMTVLGEQVTAVFTNIGNTLRAAAAR